MKQWMVAPFLLVILTGKVLAEPLVTPQSGIYAVASIEPVEANPMIDMLLPDIEERMERAWIRFDRESRGAEIYMEGQEEPLLYDFDFENQLATSPDNPTAELQLETPEQFVVIHGEPFEVAFTFQQIDENGPEFASLQSSREEWLEGEKAVIEEQERRLTELLDIGSVSSKAAVPVGWSLPYIFNMPADWVRGGITFNDKELFVAEGLGLSTLEEGVDNPLLYVGRLVMDDDAFKQRIVESGYTQHAFYLEAPRRSMTIFMDEFGDIGLLGFVPSERDETSFWYVPPGAGEQILQDVIAMFHTARMQDNKEELAWFTNPGVWPDYRLTESSEQKLREHIENALFLEGFLDLAMSSMASTEGVSLSDGGDYLIHTALKVFRADEELEPLSPNPPLLIQGSREEGRLTLWDNGACEASLIVPIVSPEMEELTYLGIYKQVNSYLDEDPGRWEQGHCIAIWSALQNFRDRLESTYVTEVHPTLARSLAPFVTAYTQGGYILVVEQVDGERLRGLLSLGGETVLSTQFERINIFSDGIVAEDAQGEWVFSDTGEKLLPMPLMSFFPVEGLEGLYIALYKNEKEEVRYGLFDMNNKDMVVPLELGDLSFDEEKEVLLAEYPDGSEAVLSPDGENIGERFASIYPLSGTSNYLVKDAVEGLWYFADERLEKQSEPFASATLHRRARLVFVRFPEAEHEQNDPSPAYFNYDGNRVTSPEMTPAYAPSEDGFITVWTETRPFLGILGAPEKRWGLIDRSGEVVIPLEYDQLHQEREGVVPVRRDDAFAVFSEDGSQLTDFEWGNLSLSFSGGLMARHPLFNEWQLIDHQGRLRNQDVFTERPVHVAARHHESSEITDMFVALHDRKFGMLSAEGEIVVPFIFDSVDARFNEPVFTNSEGRDKRYPYDFRE